MPLHMSEVPKACQRCGSDLPAWTVSMFNTQVICMACKQTEKKHPQYEHAVDVECDAVRQGDLNFPGIGLPADLEGGGRLWELPYRCGCGHEWTQEWASASAKAFCPACRVGPTAPCGPAKAAGPGVLAEA